MFLLVGNLARVVNYMSGHMMFSFRTQNIVLYESMASFGLMVKAIARVIQYLKET